tara:strand:- start:394 stop:1431 length:1038 start_codon:yes stop_codon:yes gene_type:complete
MGKNQIIATLGTDGDTSTSINGTWFDFKEGVFVSPDEHSSDQAQTGDLFGYFWQKEDEGQNFSNDPESSDLARYIAYSVRRDFPGRDAFLQSFITESPNDKVACLDAGCGIASSFLSFFKGALDSIDYCGIDISSSIWIARKNLIAHGLDPLLIRGDIARVSLPKDLFDIVYCPYVLQHTDAPLATLRNIIHPLRIGGGAILSHTRPFAPLRTFSDNMIREQIRDMDHETKMEKLAALSELAQQLFNIKTKIKLESPVDVLGIPAGEYPLQELFYDYFVRAYYDDSRTFDNCNLENLDWFGPSYYHTLSTENFVTACEENGLEIISMNTTVGTTSVLARKIFHKA